MPCIHRILSLLLLTGAALTLSSAAVLAHGDESHDDDSKSEATGHSHERAESHGGAVTMTETLHLESVFLPDGIRIYVYDGQQNPVDLTTSQAGGTVRVQFRDRTKKPLEARLQRVVPASEDEHDNDDHGDDDDHGDTDAHTQSYLAAPLDLSGVTPGQARARFALHDLPGQKEEEITFLQKLEFAADHAEDDDHDEGQSESHPGHQEGERHP